MPDRLLITGASGFVGRVCLRLLDAAGVQIHAVSRTPPSTGRVEWHSADLHDTESIEKLVSLIQPTHLLHLAWIATPGLFWSSVENVRWVESSLSLVRAFLRVGGARLVVAGSCSEYDWRFGYCREDFTPTRPSSLYGASKNALREVLTHLCQKAGSSLTWARLFWLYGPNEDSRRFVPSVARALLCREPIDLTSGEQVRDFLHVEDAARALVHLLSGGLEGPVNVASGRPVSLRSVAEMLASELGSPDILGWGNRPTPVDEPHLVVADVTRLLASGFEPCYRLEEGLLEAARWWRERPSEATCG